MDVGHLLADEPLVAVLQRGVATYPPGATFGPRPLHEWEFVWIIEGDARYSRHEPALRQPRTMGAPAGSLLLCCPNATDSFSWDTKRRTRHAYFHFTLRYSLLELHGWPTPDAWSLVRPVGPDDLQLNLFRHVLADSNDDLARDLSATLLLRLFVTGKSGADTLAPDDPPEVVSRALSFLYSRLDEDAATTISLDMLARAACVSSEHLCRTFKASTGHTPLETVRLARLDRAATLLSRSNYSVSEIGRLCGFGSSAHFSRAFREAFNLTPREVRTRLGKGETPPLSRLLRAHHHYSP